MASLNKIDIIGIPESLVYNKEFFKNISNISKCTICLNIMINPQECQSENCDKTFCLNCINIKKKCPNCDGQKYHQSNKAIRLLLSKIEIICFHDNCNEKINYDGFVLHVQNCLFKKVNCNKCNIQVIAKNYDLHIKSECNKHEKEDIISLSDNSEGSKIKSDLDIIKFNIEKIVRDQDEKFNNIESDNQKLNNEIKEKMKLFVEKLSMTKNNNDNINRDKQVENLINEISNKLVEGVGDKLNINEINIDIGEKFQKFLQTLTNTQISEDEILKIVLNFIKLSENNILNNIESVKNQILKETNSIITSNLKYTKSSKETQKTEIATNEFNILKLSVQNILLNEKKNSELLDKLVKLKEKPEDIEVFPNINVNQITMSLNQKILDNLDQKITDIKNKFTDIKITIPDKIQNECKNIKTNIQTIITQSREIKTFINENVSEINNNYNSVMEKIFKDITDKFNLEINKHIPNDNIEKVNKSLNKNGNSSKEELEILIRTFFEDYNNKIEKEIKYTLESKTKNLRENLKDLKEGLLVDSENEKIRILQNNYENLSEQINEIPTTIENMKIEFSSKLKEKFKNIDPLSNSINDTHNSSYSSKRDTKNSNLASNHEFNKMIEKSISDNLETKFITFQKKIESNFSQKIKSMYELKFCKECKKVDYFFGFTKCDNCKSENCKQCVLLCKGCKKLLCKKCISCSKCSSLYCEKCKHSCCFCSEENKEKYCLENCIKKCLYCHREICVKCIKTCMNCKNLICFDCSKSCNICLNCSCARCETVNNFKYCYFCKGNCCENCVQVCKFCDLEICSKCSFACKNCKKIMCNKCGKSCNNCNEIYCNSCEKTLLTIKCNHCKKNFCTFCLQNVKKCKQCNTTNCKACCSVCRKCKTSFCNSCNINCDNCEDYSCASCIYKCICDNIVFCETCLFDVRPIGPHECVLFLNDAPSFSGVKTRSKTVLPRNFEAKFYIERFENSNLLIGITDNFYFEQDTITYIDNIWTLKAKTGEKYSSEKSIEKLLDKSVREKDFVIVAIKNNQLYFRVNFDDTLPAYMLPPHKNYYIYIENDTPNLATRVHFVYIRKI